MWRNTMNTQSFNNFNRATWLGLSCASRHSSRASFSAFSHSNYYKNNLKQLKLIRPTLTIWKKCLALRCLYLIICIMLSATTGNSGSCPPIHAFLLTTWKKCIQWRRSKRWGNTMKTNLTKIINITLLRSESPSWRNACLSSRSSSSSSPGSHS